MFSWPVIQPAYHRCQDGTWSGSKRGRALAAVVFCVKWGGGSSVMEKANGGIGEDDEWGKWEGYQGCQVSDGGRERGWSSKKSVNCKLFVADKGNHWWVCHTREQDQTLRSEDENEYIVQEGKVDYRREWKPIYMWQCNKLTVTALQSHVLDLSYWSDLNHSLWEYLWHLLMRCMVRLSRYMLTTWAQSRPVTTDLSNLTRSWPWLKPDPILVPTLQ